MDALRTGAAQPTHEQMGHRVDLPDAMREKMENAFGADLSAVKLYESQTVADAGANAVTQGTNIAFAPGMLDFTGYGGQALLGHELSHVVSQQRGEVTGGGFLNDRTLEARADREGAMAAAGQQVAMPTGAMSSVNAASAAGPMQADKSSPVQKFKDWREDRAKWKAGRQNADEMLRLQSGVIGESITPEDQQLYDQRVMGMDNYTALSLLDRRAKSAKALGAAYDRDKEGTEDDRDFWHSMSDHSTDMGMVDRIMQDYAILTEGDGSIDVANWRKYDAEKRSKREREKIDHGNDVANGGGSGNKTYFKTPFGETAYRVANERRKAVYSRRYRGKK